MIDRDFIDTLIGHGREDPQLEWKQQLNIHHKAGQAEFIRDVLSLVNAHGPGSRYLLIGVRDDGEVVGVEERIDDATLQQIVSNRIEPPVDFATTYVAYSDLMIGVLEITASSKRFHVVSRDLNENHEQYLKKGETWINRGSSKGPPDAWDYERLREVIREEGSPQPIISLSFAEDVNRVVVCPVWSIPDERPRVQSWLTTPAWSEKGPPPGTAEMAFVVSNRGECGAEDIRVSVELPEDCKVYEPPLGSYVIGGGHRSTSIWVDEEDNEIGIRVDSLTHRLRTRVLVAQVTFPEPDRLYDFTWTGHASNMKQQTEGVLRVQVIR